MKFKDWVKNYIYIKDIISIENESNCKITIIDDLILKGRGSYDYIPGLGDKDLWINDSNVYYSLQGDLLNEGISSDQYGLDKFKGGCIVFSTDVNISDVSKNSIIKWFKNKWKSLVNRFKKDKKLTDIISNIKDIGAFSIGNFFKGRYISNDKTYDEKSTSIEVLGIPSEILIRLATEIAKSFKQETVLLKDYNTGKNLLIDQK